MSAMINVEDLAMSYDDQLVLEDINLAIPANSKTAIIGPNGAGKSTLLNCMLDFLKPLKGKVTFNGKIYKDYYKMIAYVPQSSSVNWDFPTTVLDVVLMGRYVYQGFFKKASQSDKDRALEALASVNMTDYADRQIAQLSGGQRQRVFLARAICQDADIYFLDEPMKGIDIKTEKLFKEIINQFQRDGKTIVIVHHDLATVREYFDHVILLNRTIIGQGPVEETFNESNISMAYDQRIGEIYGHIH
ncbi:metal ABC transporter ATP-binding protein [Aerococcus urinaeequi]|uniref:Peptide transporter n=1 Tax=Aerococcus viridans TaxID=1377 RepID=A0A2N6UEB1_9LACT|nr:MULTISPECIES: metal ABC transporter ATP-binding protein [Aerococcus]PMC79897.1 peptide transporter [Aerococcus viridans]